MKTVKLSELEDKYIGLIGSTARNQYEFNLTLELVGEMIRTARKERKLTQEELGKLVGVQKAQVSRLENSAPNVTLDTLLRVFNALHANVRLQVNLVENAF